MDSDEPNERTVVVPLLVGLRVREARDVGQAAGVLVTADDVDGPPLGALTWPGVWYVTSQRPAPGQHVPRWGMVAIRFEEWRGGDGGGDREPRLPRPDPGALTVELDPVDDTSPSTTLDSH